MIDSPQPKPRLLGTDQIGTINMRAVLAFIAVLWLMVPASAQDTPIAAETTAEQDADIATRLREIFSALGGFEDVTVVVDEGVVTLRGTTLSTDDATRVGGLAGRVEGVVAVQNEITETTEIGRRIDPALDRFRARIEQLIAIMPLALVAIGLFAAISLLGYVLAGMRQPWDRFAPNSFIANIYRQIIRLVFLVAGLVVALDFMNATALLGTFLGAAGIVGLALGFAVRDTVENFIASIMLSLRQPFRPNDTVEINGDQGKVIRLTSRATILLSFDGNHIRIPNSTVFKSRIVNFSQHDERRFTFSILIDRGCDLQEARLLMESTLTDLPFVLPDPAPLVWIEEIGTSGARMDLAGWIDQKDTSIVLAKGEALRQIKRALSQAGIVMPDSTQNVVVTRKNPDQSEETEPAIVAPVTPTDDHALNRIVDAERHEDASEDLLRQDAPQE